MFFVKWYRMPFFNLNFDIHISILVKQPSLDDSIITEITHE